jgi:hypothetical protein
MGKSNSLLDDSDATLRAATVDALSEIAVDTVTASVHEVPTMRTTVGGTAAEHLAALRAS